MAFVYRSEQRGTYIPKSDIVGPGQYDALPPESKPNPRPFNSTVLENLKISTTNLRTRAWGIRITGIIRMLKGDLPIR